MKSGKLLFLVAVGVALFAVLQIAESSIEDDSKAIKKHVDDEFKKLSKRAADDEDDGSKHKKSKKRKGGSNTTAAPGDKSTTAAPGGSTTTKGPGGSTTTKGSGGSASTTKAADPSTTKAPSGSSSTKSPGTGKPDGSTTTTGKPGNSTTPKSDMTPAIAKQEEERTIIRNAFKELVKWQEWLHSNQQKTLNPKAARATWQMADKIRRIIESSNGGGKARRFHGKLDTTW